MFLSWQARRLVLQHLEGMDQLDPRIARLDHFVHITTGGGLIGVGELVFVLLFFFSKFSFWVVRILDLFSENDLRRSLCAHHGDLSTWPCEVHIGTNVF